MSATMSDLVLLFFILLFQVHNQYSASAKDSFIAKPDKEVYGHEGSDVTLEWYFNLGSRSSSPYEFREFVFGTWVSPGSVRNIILIVKEHNVVSKRRGFERKVDWTGNIFDCEKCNVKIKINNLTSADFKTYGVEVDRGLYRKPLTNWVKIVQFEPAKIIKWQQRIKVEEGNTTAIECKATGRPSPSVIIKTNNRTLCYNNTGYCVYLIPAATPVHEGQYLCLVQQRNSTQIRRSLNLTVLEGQTPPETDIEDNRTTNNNTIQLTSMAVVAIILSVIIVLAALIILAVCLCRFCRARGSDLKPENVLIELREYHPKDENNVAKNYVEMVETPKTPLNIY